MTQSGLGLADPGVLNTSGNGGTQSLVINQNNTYTLTNLTGSGTYTLVFTWTSRSRSDDDESGARLGHNSSSVTGCVSPCTYPGAGSRNVATDGHFVTITAEAIPEPGTLSLLVVGLSGLARWGRRRA